MYLITTRWDATNIQAIDTRIALARFIVGCFSRISSLQIMDYERWPFGSVYQGPLHPFWIPEIYYWFR